MIFDQYWWMFAIPTLIIGVYAQMRLSSAYNRYARVGVASGLTGADAAREILDQAGLNNMPVCEVGGHLTDHYDPMKRALFLSSENFRGNSIAAVGVAAHEAGHALQHKAAYAPLKFRMALVPVTQFASMAWQGILLLGLFSGMVVFHKLIGLAIAICLVTTLFQLITLPVEFDASRRAKEQLLRLGLIRADESVSVSKVLNAAAMTYVAAMATAMLTLAHLILIARSGDRR